ncbi:MAG: glycosyltransferase family 39 protein [Desulfarculaceae bacterium]
MIPSAATHNSPQKALWVLAAVLAFSLLLRAGVLIINYQADPQRVIALDTASYENPALALMQTGRFAMAPDRLQEPEIVRTPGYPLFMAAVYTVLGKNHLLLALAQVLLSLLTMVVCFWLAKRLWGANAAALAVIFLALDSTSFLFSQRLMSEALFNLLLLAALGAGVMLFQTQGRRWPWVLALGSLSALATLVRPVTYFLIIPLTLLGAVYFWITSRNIKQLTALVLLLLLPWVVLIGGWQARNYMVSGSAKFSHISSVNLLKYWAAGVTALKEGITREEAESRLKAEVADTQPKSRVQLYDAYAQKSLEVIKDNPGLTLKAHLRAMAGMLLVPMVPDLMVYLGFKPGTKGPLGDLLRLPLGDFWSKWGKGRPGELAAHLLGLLYLALIYAGALLGLVLLLLKQRQGLCPHALLWLVIIYMVEVSSGPGSYARARCPIMPLFCLYAAFGWRWLYFRLLGHTGGQGQAV